MEGEFTIDVQRDYGNRHKGKMAFLLGCGVSLDEVDTDLLKPYITMGINQSLFKLPDPDYFFTCDGLIFINGLLDIINREKTEVIFIEELCPEYNYDTFAKERNLPKFGLVRRKYNIPEPESSTARNTDNALAFGKSSVHPAAHLLHIMGCDPIVLLGCECRFTGALHSFWMLEKYRSQLLPAYLDANGNPFHPTPYPQHLQGYLNEFKEYWERMKNLEPSIPIINACNGVMTNLPKMTLAEVLDTYGDRKK